MTDYSVGSTIYLMFTTRSFSTGAPAQLAGTPAVSAYENDSLTQITAGITLGVDHDSVTGLNLLTIVATGANGYEAGKDYNMVITTGTVGGVSVVGEVVGTFSLERSAAIDEIGAAGAGLTEAGGDGDHLTTLATAANLATAQTDLDTLTGADGAIIASGTQTFNMTGNITGNLSGSVGSVTGAVGSVTGAVGSVTGNVGGNVAGSVGSVTGNVGGNVAGSVASVTAGVTLDASATSAQLVDDIMDESIIGANHNVNGSLAKFVREGAEANAMLTGTAQSATSTTLVLASGAVTANDILNGERVSILEGTGAGQSRLITGSVASTDTITVAQAWVTNPDNTSIYAITGAEVMVRGVSGQTVSATATVDFDDLATIEAVTSNLNDFDPAVDVVANVTLVDTTTTNTDMRGTDSASTHSAADVWAAVTRTLTANTNLNDPTAAAIRAEIDSNSTQLAAIASDAASLNDTKIPDTLSLANINAEVDTAFTSQMADSVPTDGTIATREQALYMILQFLTEKGAVGTTVTVRKVDGSTALMTFTLDDATTPTDITRAT